MVWVGYVGYALMAIGFVYGIYMMNKAGGDPENMDPSSLDDFQITKADEGSAVPLIYGRRKLTGNLIWYGNFETEPIWEKVDAGKDDEWVITGYNYYLDVWQTLGHGDMTIIQTYVQEELKDVTCRDTVFNTGSNGLYSTIPGEFANKMDGVCHVFYQRMLLGENVQTLPTIHFVVERELGSECPVAYKNLANGVNPAAIVYDLLVRGGASTGEIDLTSFDAAATYWYNKGYGLNIIFKNRPKTRDAIKQVLSQVGAAFGQDNQGRFYLNPLDEDDAASVTLDFDSGDLGTFSFERTTWDRLHTDFNATYIDEDQNYTERTVKAYNPAVARILARRIEKGVKLQGFRDLTTTSKRIWEIMKEGTYPFASIAAQIPMRYHDLKLGEVVNVSYAEYGISNAEFRVMSKTIRAQTENALEVKLRQKTEALYDSNFMTVGGSVWSRPSYTPSIAHAVKYWQLPYNHITNDTTSYLLLVARTNSYETGFALYLSPDGTEYEVNMLGRLFSQYGTLDDDYPVTIEIDELVGITYTPYQEDPKFDTTTIEVALQMPRLALIGDELIGFATVTLNANGSITLTDCIRGMLGTTIATHTSGDPIWLFHVDQRLVLQTELPSFYLKAAPYSIQGVVDASTVNAVSVTKNATKSLPPAPELYIEDNVTDLTVTLLGHFFDTSGAGMTGESAGSTDAIPSGRIGWKVYSTGTPTYVTTNPFSVQRTTATLYFWYEKDGVKTAERSVVVVYADLPKYYGPSIPDADSQLVKISYGMQNWLTIADFNASRVDNYLLQLNNLLDVDPTGIADEDYLVFDTALGKFTPVSYADMIDIGVSLENLPTFEGEHGPYDDGSITASSYNGNYVPQHSWDGGDGSYYPQWIIADPGSEVFPDVTGSHWIQWDWTDHGVSHDLRGIRLCTRYNDATDRWPSAVKVLASNTGAFAGEEVILYDGVLTDAETIGPSNWTTWTAFDQTANFGFYVHHRVVITDVYTYDSGYYWFAVDQWQFKEALAWTFPASLEVIYGATFDGFDSIFYDENATNETLQELTLIGITGSVPLEVNLLFENVTESDVYFTVIGHYEGDPAHNAKVYVYNYTDGDWEAISADTTDMEHRTSESIYEWNIADTTDYVDSDQMKFKLRVENAGDDTDKFVMNKVALGTEPHDYYDLAAWSTTEYNSSYDYIILSYYNRVFTKTGGGWDAGCGAEDTLIDLVSGVYFEMEVIALAGTSASIGLQNYSTRYEWYVGDFTTGWGYFPSGLFYNSSSKSYGSGYSKGDVVGFAIKDNKIWVSVNGSWQGGGDPVAGTGEAYSNLNGTVYPAMSSANEGTKILSRFRDSQLVYTPPSGFTPLVVTS